MAIFCWTTARRGHLGREVGRSVAEGARRQDDKHNVRCEIGIHSAFPNGRLDEHLKEALFPEAKSTFLQSKHMHFHTEAMLIHIPAH